MYIKRNRDSSLRRKKKKRNRDSSGVIFQFPIFRINNVEGDYDAITQSSSSTVSAPIFPTRIPTYEATWLSIPFPVPQTRVGSRISFSRGVSDILHPLWMPSFTPQPRRRSAPAPPNPLGSNNHL